MDYKKVAQILFQSQIEAIEIGKITQDYPELTVERAYLVQDELLKLQFGNREKKIGYKMGLTSKSKMKQMGVHSPIYGVLTDRMKCLSGESISLKNRIHPKVEPEIAFLIDQTLQGRVTVQDVLNSCSGVCAAMEIIDSRYRNFEFTLPDVVADNCSSSSFVLGDVVKNPKEFDFRNLGIILEKDGSPVQFGSSAAIYGDPAASVAELCSMLGARGLALEAGSVVLAGAATAAIPLELGSEYAAVVQGLGRVSIKVG